LHWVVVSAARVRSKAAMATSAGAQDVEQLASDTQLEEELVEVPAKESEKDPYMEAEVKKNIDGRDFTGYVTSIDVGAESQERLYLVEYTDGEVEHYTAEDVKHHLVAMNGKSKKRPAGKGRLGRDEDEAEDEEDDVKEPPSKKARSPTKVSKGQPKSPTKVSKATLKKPAAAAAAAAAAPKAMKAAAMKVAKGAKAAAKGKATGKAMKAAGKARGRPMKKAPTAMKKVASKAKGKKAPAKGKAKPKRR